MPNLVAVSNSAHAGFTVDEIRANSVLAGSQLIPVVPVEFSQLATEMPIVLTKHGDTGQFCPVALTGFDSHENLLCNEQGWQTIVVPLQAQRQPFFIGQDDKNSTDEYTICFDSNSELVSANGGGQRIFSDAGADTEFFARKKQVLGALLAGEQHSQQLISRLLEYQLIQPMRVDIKFESGKSTQLNGLYTVDRQALSALTEAQLKTLQQEQLLEAIYAILISQGQIYRLIELRNKRDLSTAA
ncbi:SapC family protein [Thalassotalea euphylliae]|uniref:SapC family protein n=1 Tax=Thalassotalea euphylliae TaxID=1655234 RepID=UPI0036358782